MKYFLIFFFFILICIASGNAQIINTTKQIYYIEKKHKFSSDSTQDLFRLSIRGKNIFDGVVSFQIFNSTGKRIFNENFTVGELMEFGPPEIDDAFQRSREDSGIIVKVLNQFFDERNFIHPAVQDSSEMEYNFSSINDWSLIREDRSAIGFNYRLGTEDERRIAFCKKKKKVILYYKCCLS